MRIAVFHQHYLMPGQGGGSRFNEMARLWTESGHEVLVAAGSVNYAGAASSGRGLIRPEKDGQTVVWRCYVPDSYHKSYLGRMWAFFVYSLTAGLAALKMPRPDVIIATSPPLIAVIPAWIASRCRWRRVPWIFEVRDLWPESAVTTGILRADSVLTKLLYAIEAWACRRADLVNVLTPAFQSDLVRRGLVPVEKIVFVPNGSDVTLFEPGPRENQERLDRHWGNKTVALYAGAHGRANALRQLIDAAEALRERDDILIVSAGSGPELESLRREVRERGLSNIQFPGPAPKDRMPELVRAADIGLAVLQNNPTFETVYPNKVFDYMACERPTVLAIGGVAKQLVCDEAKAGVFATPEDGVSIALQIASLAENVGLRDEMEKRGRAWALANAARPALADRYLEILTGLAKRTQVRPQRLKRALDIAASMAGLVVLFPVMVVVWLAVRLQLGSPAIFAQMRGGENNRTFRFFKFRTMTDARDAKGELLPDHLRLTALGRYLRSTSLDELPQLWNVLRGDMSLVGPRPLLAEYLPLYNERQKRRHEVRPGITGWAQIHGRNALDWEEKFDMDIWYADHVNLRLDLQILWRTLLVALRRESVDRHSLLTMPKFSGTKC